MVDTVPADVPEVTVYLPVDAINKFKLACLGEASSNMDLAVAGQALLIGPDILDSTLQT